MVTPAQLSDLFADVERQQDEVLVVWLHPEQWVELREHGRDSVWLETDHERLKQGIHGMIWGALIRVNSKQNIYLETKHGTNPRPSRWDRIKGQEIL